MALQAVTSWSCGLALSGQVATAKKPVTENMLLRAAQFLGANCPGSFVATAPLYHLQWILNLSILALTKVSYGVNFLIPEAALTCLPEGGTILLPVERI